MYTMICCKKLSNDVANFQSQGEECVKKGCGGHCYWEVSSCTIKLRSWIKVRNFSIRTFIFAFFICTSWKNNSNDNYVIVKLKPSETNWSPSPQQRGLKHQSSPPTPIVLLRTTLTRTINNYKHIKFTLIRPSLSGSCKSIPTIWLGSFSNGNRC